MKKFLLVIIINSLCISCSFQTTPKPKVQKAAQYESGNKEAGIIYMSITYNPLVEDASLDYVGTMLNANSVCNNWGYKGVDKVQEETVAKCQSFNYNTGQCLLYKATIVAYCK